MKSFKRIAGIIGIGVGLALVAAPLTQALAGPPEPWMENCKKCHGEDGKGQTKMGKKKHVADMSTAEWQKKFSDDDIKKIIKNGFKREKNGVKQKMKAYDLPADQVDAIIKFIRSLKK